MSNTVLLVDDHRILREGLRRLIELSEGLEVTGEASDGLQAVELAKQLNPDIVVMDIWMPRLSGIEATVRINEAKLRSKVLILSVHDSHTCVEQALQAGAAGYLLKTSAASELIDAIDTVMGGMTYLSPDITQRVVDALGGVRSPVSRLTSREREILQLIAEGTSGKEIANQLGVSHRTVESHRAKLMDKIGIHKATELVRFAIREGLVAP